MEAHYTRIRSQNVLMIDEADEECEHGDTLHQNHKLECIDQTGIDMTTDTHASWYSLKIMFYSIKGVQRTKS